MTAQSARTAPPAVVPPAATAALTAPPGSPAPPRLSPLVRSDRLSLPGWR